MKKCPFCAEEIQDQAKVCKHCGRDVVGGGRGTVEVTPQKKGTSPVTYGCLVILGLIGLVFVVGKFAGDKAPDAVRPNAATGSSLAPTANQNQRDAEEEKRFLKTAAGKVWAKHKDWDRETCKAISQRKIRIGKTTEQVRAAWGRPESVNSTTYSFGTHEQWVYGIGQYVYFENGIMTSMQQSK